MRDAYRTAQALGFADIAQLQAMSEGQLMLPTLDAGLCALGLVCAQTLTPLAVEVLELLTYANPHLIK